MNKTTKVLSIIATIVLIGLCAIIGYGLSTDCPNTSPYVHCN